MSQVGEYFAKMLLAKRHADAINDEAVGEQAAIELELCLTENADTLNSYPGIDGPILSVERSDNRLEVCCLETGLVAYLSMHGKLLRLSRHSWDGDENIRIARAQRYSDEQSGIEWYEVNRTETGLSFFAEAGDPPVWTEYSTNVIVSRAFGYAINGHVSSRFGDGQLREI